MSAIVTRWLGCVLTLYAGMILWPQAIQPAAVLPASLLLLLFYVLLRPLLLTLLLPLNMLLLGLLTPLADALFLLWTAAWVGGLALTYWQSVALALLLSLCYWPYARYREGLLIKNSQTATK